MTRPAGLSAHAALHVASLVALYLVFFATWFARDSAFIGGLGHTGSEERRHRLNCKGGQRLRDGFAGTVLEEYVRTGVGYFLSARAPSQVILTVVMWVAGGKLKGSRWRAVFGGSM